MVQNLEMELNMARQTLASGASDEALRQEIEKYRREASEARHATEQLERALAQAKSQLETATAAGAAAGDTAANSEELQRCKTKLEEAQAEQSVLEEAFVNLKEELAASSSKLSVAEALAEEAQTARRELDDELAKAKENVIQSATKVNEAEAKAEQFRSLGEQACSMVQNLEMELNMARQTLAADVSDEALKQEIEKYKREASEARAIT